MDKKKDANLDLVNSREFAKRTGYPLSTVRRLIRQGSIRALVEGRRMLMDFETAKTDMEYYIRTESERRLKSCHLYDSANCVPYQFRNSAGTEEQSSKENYGSAVKYETSMSAGVCRVGPSFQEQLQFVKKELMGRKKR